MFDAFVRKAQKYPTYKLPNNFMNDAIVNIMRISDYTTASDMQVDDTDTMGFT